MNTDVKRMRAVPGRRYPDYDKLDLTILADARRWLNDHAGMKEQSQFTPEEAERRIAYYRRQLESQGQITRWLPSVASEMNSVLYSQFARYAFAPASMP